MKKWSIILLTIVGSMLANSCKKDLGINIFTIQQDKDFGAQFASDISKDPATYPVLDPIQYKAAYDHLNRIKNNILVSGEFTHKKDFTWEVRIINKNVLNAFATPGGYLYFYTGIIKYLDNEAQFAGVLAHEMAHADRRHSTKQMTDMFGFNTMLALMLGQNPGQMAQLAAGLAQGLTSLQFTRNDEYEADTYAVKYLKDTEYNPKSLEDFFLKMDSGKESDGTTPTFLRTHPKDADRVANIEKVWAELGSPTGQTFEARYADFKASLP